MESHNSGRNEMLILDQRKDSIYMKRVCIITWHQYHGFGSQLQAYALLTVLNRKGFDAAILNYRKAGNSSDYYKDALKRVIGSCIEKTKINQLQRFRFPWERFEYSYLNLRKVISRENLKAEVLRYDAIICGSDQIWAPNEFDPIYMANFVSNERVRKISYAASIGLNNIPDNLVEEYKDLLSEFYAISVREKTGADLIKAKTGLNAVVVLDPTLLLSSSDYSHIEIRPVIEHERYVFCYFLNKNHWYSEFVKQYCTEHHVKAIGISANECDYAWIDKAVFSGPREFLWYIHNAESVFTDSYHGTIFSLIYHRPFFTFQRFTDDDPINQNSRIYQLMEYFGFKDRWIDNKQATLPESTYSFSTFDVEVEKNRAFSLNYLMEALKG